MNKSTSPAFTISRRGLLVKAALLSAPLAFSQLANAAPGVASTPGPARVNIDHFVQDCIDANRESDPQSAVLEVLESAVRDPRAMRSALGEPSRAGIDVIYRSTTLTIFNATWTPQMNLRPHNHLMWANIGIYTGREDNIFWSDSGDRISAFGANALFEGDAAPLPVDAIHSVTNPLLRFTGGIHIYGGDFFETTRSEWDPETLAEGPSDGEDIRALFKRENERLGI